MKLHLLQRIKNFIHREFDVRTEVERRAREATSLMSCVEKPTSPQPFFERRVFVIEGLTLKKGTAVGTNSSGLIRVVTDDDKRGYYNKHTSVFSSTPENWKLLLRFIKLARLHKEAMEWPSKIDIDLSRVAKKVGSR